MRPVSDIIDAVKSYYPECDVKLLEKAYAFGKKAHAPQVRASGDPYFSHPIEVALILAGLRLDVATIITALLHDTVEDTDVTLDDLSREFTPEIADLVDGVTKLSQVQMKSHQHQQSENLRKFILSMSKDLRVLLVKLADRVHNMRTLGFISKPEKRARIARETLEIYAPLAERIGVNEFKDELENRSFENLYPDECVRITEELVFLDKDGHNLVDDTINALQKVLDDHKIKADIAGRVKRPYSIWRKMRQKNVSFHELFDIIAFRCLVDDLADCYQVLGILHSKFPVIIERFKDYISTPKPNGYRSLHTGILGPNKQRIEVQIRTKAMHEIAEYGIAAHWQYKGSGGSAQMAADRESKDYRWLRELIEILEETPAPEEFLENTKMEMFDDQVFVFSPGGDVYNLPRHATPVDFAYAVHSEVGDKCQGAKVNGRIVPLRTPLENGDKVEILTSKNGSPSPEWERFVVTGKAIARIRRFIRLQRRDEYYTLGQEMMQKALKQEDISYREKDLENYVRALELKDTKIDDLEEYFVQIGMGRVNPRDFMRQTYPDKFYEPQEKASTEEEIESDKFSAKREVKQASLGISGLIPGMAVHYAKCCHPIPGDRITGVIRVGRGVAIHKKTCGNLKNFIDQPGRIMHVSWDLDQVEKRNHFVGRLSLIVMNGQGVLSEVSTQITKHNANIADISIQSRSTDFYQILMDVEVNDLDHLENVITSLRLVKSVNSVERISE